MTVLLVCCDFSLSGGSEKVALKLYKELKEKIDIKIVSLFCQNGISSFDESEVIYLIHKKGSLRKDAIRATKKLSRVVKTYGADIIIAVGVSASFYVCISGKINHIKTIVCEHSNISNKYYNNLGQVFSRSLSVSLCDKFITLTEEDMMGYISRYPRHKEKFEYIYNWIEWPDDINSSIYNMNSKKIITVSRIDRVKGIEYSIQVYEKIASIVPEWSWDVYGEGDYEYLKELNAYIDNKGIKGFCFKGFSKDIDSIYENAAIYCCTSIYEGLPLSLLEAKSHRIPIVSFDCKTGPKEIIEDGINGYLVKQYDLELFVSKLLSLITNESIRKEMSEKSYSNIDKFGKKIIIEKWLELLNEMMEK